MKSIQLARKVGITSLAQLECFLIIAAHEGETVEGILGRDPTHTDYKRFMQQVRKLMAAGYRGSDGLKLIKSIGGPKESRLGLTGKGRRLLNSIQN